jgi:hypothetical protein
VVQIWPGQTVTSLHTISPGHIWTTLYLDSITICWRNAQKNDTDSCKINYSSHLAGETCSSIVKCSQLSFLDIVLQTWGTSSSAEGSERNITHSACVLTSLSAPCSRTAREVKYNERYPCRKSSQHCRPTQTCVFGFALLRVRRQLPADKRRVTVYHELKLNRTVQAFWRKTSRRGWQ